METTYLIDRDDRIIQVSGSWDEFAAENDGAQAMSTKVIGRSLWSFISDNMTRDWLRALINYSRRRDTAVERPYRCDAPNERRVMNMKIIPREQDAVIINHTLLFTEPIWPPVDFQPAAPNNGQEDAHHRCSICNRVKVAGEWQEPHTLQKFADLSRPVVVIYEVCEDCQGLLPGQ